MSTIIKKIISTVTAAALLSTAAVFDVPKMMAAEVTGEGYTFDPDTGRLTVTSNEGTTSWRNNADIDEEAVISVDITEFVMEIGDEAFQDCTNLTSVNIFDMVMTIGDSAFRNCSSLASINIPVMVNEIGANAFNGSGLTSVIIPSAFSVGKDAFLSANGKLKYAFYSGRTEGIEEAFGSLTTLLKYSALTNDGYKIAEITLGADIDTFTITDEMNICFVDEEQRTKVAQTGHTHIYDEGREENLVKTSNCVICNDEKTETFESHHHCVCGAANCTDPDHDRNDITWTAVSDLSDLSSGGYYYLTEKVELTQEVAIDGDITLCLNGHTVTANNKSRIFNIKSGGYLTLCDCCGSGNLTGGKENYGGAVLLGSRDSGFTMYGGTIKGNYSGGKGGGGNVNVNGGVFIMNGGRISENSAQYAAGVYVGDSSTFTMNGGEITENISEGDGGGVFVNGTFIMNGGKISQNSANRPYGYNGGGGVYVNYNGNFIMNGGTISENRTFRPDNKGGGIYVSSSSNTSHNVKITLNGNVNITDNKNFYGKPSNIYLTNYVKLTVEDDFSPQSPIGISSITTPTCTTYADLTEALKSDLSGSFTADIEGQNIVFKDNTIQLTAAHKPETDPAVEPTCTDTGLTEGAHCSVCNTVLTAQEEIEALKHNWGDEYRYNDEQHWQVCARENCGAETEKQDHTWDEGTVTKPATEEAEGEMTYTCTVCGKTKIETIEKHTHKWSDAYVSDENYHWHECTECHAHDNDEEHNWNDGEVTTEPTEDSEGVKTFTCTVCRLEKTEPVPKLDHTHTYSDTWSSDENGHWHEATCGHDEKGSLGEHDFGAPTVTPSTCTQAGSKVSVCKICQYEKKETLPLSEHTFDGSEWGSDENSHWQICAVCHTAKSVEAEHIWDDGTIIKQPSADEPGEKRFECTVCGKSKTETIPASGDEENPDDPSNPDNPDDPSNPDNPDDPSDPDNPDDPSNPDNPDDPSNPDNPEDPSDPDNPYDPSNPDNPDNPSNPDNPDDTDKGNISTEVQPDENVPDTEFGTPLDELIKAVLTPEEQELADEGVEIKIVLTVRDGTSSVSEEDKEKVETVISEISDCKLVQYLDVNLLKIIGNNQEKVIETGAPITVMFAVPEGLRAKERVYSVIRVHNGETDILYDLDSNTNTVTIETDKFSTYALTYTEKTNVTPPSTSSPGGNGFTVPDVSGSQSSEPESSESVTADSGVPQPVESETADGYVTPSESAAPSYNYTELPGVESASGDESSTDFGNVAASVDNNNSMSDENAANKNNDGNPSTGIALSFIPIAAAITVLTAAVKRKKK